ncbi:MAG: hypothetical protein JJU19_12450 [Pararhodobacter sp.]|nr:hypothetical protein [Pararhodobacter sp.]
MINQQNQAILIQSGRSPLEGAQWCARWKKQLLLVRVWCAILTKDFEIQSCEDQRSLDGNGKDQPVTILVSGPPRIGKSIISKAIADRIGAEVVLTDRLRAGFRSAFDPSFSRISRYTKLMCGAQSRGSDLILEGVDLLKPLANKTEKSLNTLLFFQVEMGCLPAIIGPTANETETTISEAIVAYSLMKKDYIFTKQGRDLDRIKKFASGLAAEQLRLGHQLMDACAKQGVPYFSIDRADYEQAAQRITEEISSWATRLNR